MTLDQETWRWALVAMLGLTLARLLVQRISPLQLYPDEAQYWVWSRQLSFGYFSKPPLIAWLIAASTALLGQAEPFVRATAPLLQGAAGLFVYAAGRRLYDGRIGLLGLLVYELCPGVQVASFVISTDTPLCCFVAAALWLYAELQVAEGRARLFAAAGFGAALGLAFLAKYAALYALIGVALHLVASPSARRCWTWPAAGLAVLAFAIVAGPNLAWNAGHGFATIAETAREADWTRRSHFDPGQLGAFLGAQLGVFGPAPFLILAVAPAWLAIRRKLAAPDLLLIAWAAPPLVIVTAQAFIAHANANWAAAAYVPGSVLVAAWLVRWRAWGWLIAILATYALVAVAILAVLVRPAIADALGAGKALQGLRGWREITRVMIERADREALTGPLSAVAVNSRYLFNEGRYYGRDDFGVTAPPLKSWQAGAQPRSAADAEAPLTRRNGQRVVAVTWGCTAAPRMMAAFAHAGGLEIDTIGLDRKNRRELCTFVGEGYLGRR